LDAGTNLLSAIFTPSNTLDYSSATDSVNLIVCRAGPGLTWTSPTSIAYGTALGSNQLDATANVPGSFAYNPANGAFLGPGTNTLNVVFSPADALDYNSATNCVSLVVSLAPIPLNIQAAGTNVVLTWDDPASVFALQAASGTAWAFTNVPGASSPFTNPILCGEQYFRLLAN
jgi:hypothetical protein